MDRTGTTGNPRCMIYIWIKAPTWPYLSVVKHRHMGVLDQQYSTVNITNYTVSGIPTVLLGNLDVHLADKRETIKLSRLSLAPLASLLLCKEAVRASERHPPNNMLETPKPIIQRVVVLKQPKRASLIVAQVVLITFQWHFSLSYFLAMQNILKTASWVEDLRWRALDVLEIRSLKSST